VEQFQRNDPATGQALQVILHEPFVSNNPWDGYQEVWLRFADGREYRTAFWRDPQQRSQYWIEEAGMIIVHDLTSELVLAAVDDILAQGSVEAAFEAIGGGG
jgi:hypothetical protein